MKKSFKKTNMALVCFFFGIIGTHRLIMGYKNWWLMPITLGGLWIWLILDFLAIISGKMTLADGTPLE